MMDETTTELLSRLLDGDLSRDEERELRIRIEHDDSLAAQLEAMRQIRSTVAALAASEKVPTELDSVLDPLVSNRPEPLPARGWVRWLATAAVVVIGLTVVIEVNRRNPGPDIGAIARQADQRADRSKQPFALAPLPTSSLAEDEQLLGASDRLLASPIPDVELAAPPPLEVLGPLEDGIAGEDTAGLTKDANVDVVSADEVMAEEKATGGRHEATAPSAAKGDHAAAAPQPGKSRARDIDRHAVVQPWEVDSPHGKAQLFVFDNGKSAWSAFTPSRRCKPGRYMVRINVVGGTVSEARPIGGAAAASQSQRLCAAELIIDLEVGGVEDGEYQAEVVVEGR
jgi:hypothetical protein